MRSWAGLRVLLLALLAFGVSPSRAARGAAEIRIVDPLLEIRGLADLESAEGRSALRLVAPRNGGCSAPVVVTGANPGELNAAVAPLTGPGGAVMPADAIRIRYAARAELEKEVDLTGRKVQPPRAELDSNFPYFDILGEQPPAEGEILPVWLTVLVPAEAEPGPYGGFLELAGSRVPVRLDVGEWVCPEPSEWVHHRSFDICCDALVEQYGVEPWSAGHWALIGRCFEMIGGLGGGDLYLAVWKGRRLAEPGWSPLAEVYPHVRFRREGERAVPQMSVVDRYLELYAQHVGRPHALVLCAYDPEVWSFGVRDARRHGWPCPSWRAVFVEEDGGQKLEMFPLPGEPSGDEAWSALMDGIRRKVVELGWGEEVIHLGLAHDGRPPQRTVDLFKRCAPYARWALWTHGRGDPSPRGEPFVLDNGLVAGHYTHAYALSLGPVGPDGVMGGWNMAYPVYTHPRKYIYQYSPLSQWRRFPEGCTAAVSSGFRQSGAGFDHVRLNAWGQKRHYGPAWSNFYRQGPRWIAAPGPDGPLGTVRMEMLREGQQETEARIVLEKAVAGSGLPADLKERCTALLTRRREALRRGGQFNRSHAEQGQTETSRLWGVPDDWQDSALELFDLAGRVSRR
jgi:sialidase-1